jgi:AcrR family transcriptional regulator
VLYRHFKDKDAVLDAVAEHGFLRYIGQKRRSAPERNSAPVLRSGWDLHIEFGLLLSPNSIYRCALNPARGRPHRLENSPFRCVGNNARIAAAGTV